MDLQTMIKRVASYIRYQDSSGNLLSSKNITSDDITNWLNDRYLEDLFTALADKRPAFFEQPAYTNNYTATGTADASSTSTTLITTEAIFTSNMVGARVLNSTDSSVATIVAYTNTTTVTLDTTIDDTWDGDTIYVFSGIYTFGGDSADLFKPLWVGVKYNSSDTDFVRATIANDEDINDEQRGSDNDSKFSQLKPVYSLNTVSVGSVPTSGITIKPIDWTEAITNGIYVKYLAMPAALSSGTDVPRLPKGFHKILVEGATADAFFALENITQGNLWETKYQISRKKLLSTNLSEREHRTVDFMSRTRDFYHSQ